MASTLTFRSKSTRRFASELRQCYSVYMTRVYEEIIDFLAGGFTPDSLIAYQPSEEAKRHVEDLIRREKNEGLAPEETSELNHYMELEHILTLAKARARARQSNG